MTQAAALNFLRPGLIRLAALPPLSVYVHLPWCLRKCPYCDFNSHESKAGQGVPEAAYVDAVFADLEAALPLVWGRPVHSIFIGGGTPSLFSPQGIERLVSGLRARLPLVPGCEVTLEANPGTFERDRFRAFAQAGVTRLSVGVQSFNDDHLHALGRVHSAEQARVALEEAAACFSTWNLDLMYALPGQTLAQLQHDLAAALAFNPPHLSIYHLTLEPNTAFARQPPPNLPSEDEAADMLDAITTATGVAGLQRYEVSAFAQPGHRCRHNLNYWRFGDYLGLGAGAHGKLSFPERVLRQLKWREPARYMAEAAAGRALSNESEVAAGELPFEFMLNALRLAEGVPATLFEEHTGLPVARVGAALACGVGKGWLEADPALIKTTARGFDFLNDVQALFLPA